MTVACVLRVIGILSIMYIVSRVFFKQNGRNSPFVIENPSENEFPEEVFEESALLDKLVELKSNCFFNVFIGK